MRSSSSSLFSSGRCGALVLAGLCVAVVGYLALRGSPWIGEIGWVPRFIADWADQNGNFRNFPVFILMGLVLIGLVGGAFGISLVLLLAVGLECGQLLVAGRTFDWADIAWSVAGVGVAWALIGLARRLRLVRSGHGDKILKIRNNNIL